MPYKHFRLQYDLRMEAESEEAEILIYGYIVNCKHTEDEPDVTAKGFDRLLREARSRGARRLTLRINSGGGSVFQAVAMRTMLLRADFEQTTVCIDGLCASAATLLACVPGAQVIISEGAMYMIHNPSSAVCGSAAAMEREAALLRRMEGDVRGIYARRSGQSEETLAAWMNAETWFTAKEAVEAGFADVLLTGAGDIAACVTAEDAAVMRSMYRRVPEPLIRNGNPTAAGKPSENTSIHKEEDQTMEISKVTMEQLRAENPGLYERIMQAGAAQERERIADIDDLTPAGYEEMAAQAKQSGTSAMAYHKQIVKAQKQKAQAHLQMRREETAAAAAVKGCASEDESAMTAAQELEAHAREMAEMARRQRVAADGGMY